MNADLDGEDSRWLIVEDSFAAALANTYETLFTTGNGYLGTRGSLEEGHEGALPGTFLRGVFDHHDSAVTDLVKAPDWLTLAIVVNGIRLAVTSASVVHHRRMLDMREGAVFRDTVFEDAEGRRTRSETVHFASSADQHLCCLRARITLENHTAPGCTAGDLPAWCLRSPRLRGHRPSQGTRLADTGHRGQRHQAGRDVGVSRPPSANARHAGGRGVPRHRVRGR